ncbi:MAG: hypothetical protein IJ064_06470 [Bacteroidaceae bacterium]|nr:hypothetical protein [Bacteroidaceae bacterium]
MDYNTLLSETEQRVLKLLNEKGQHIVQGRSLYSPRAVGDAVQLFLSEQNGLVQCIPTGTLKTFESDFERRSMEDMAFFDNEDRYYAVDCKTHNLRTLFNMPNLISVRRLANFYKNDSNYFCILIVEYEIDGKHIAYRACHFKPIEAFSWDCLTIGALGWGQIQIANANILNFDTNVNRKEWMLQLCNQLDMFYDEEIEKIGERKLWFNDIKVYWENKL